MSSLNKAEVQEILKDRPMTMDDLIRELQDRHKGLTESQAMSVILPLLSTRKIHLTSDRKLTSGRLVTA